MWCAFPERENPVQPSPSRHLAYTLAVSSVGGGTQLSALAAYTTSRPWPYPTVPLGVRIFDQAAAAQVGQHRAFLIDLRRLAYVPITQSWFPRLDELGRGIQGRASKQLQRECWQTADDLLRRHGELVERLGPLWPRGGR